ncbi:uncharacterized protein [Rutidosis leptorrhynchoides]|uniref:uncharacterized protein n=1 Tax=Rutidosis leptorrhynchoides TaxID=125765 RepID=UPI003A99BCA2
MAFEVRWRKWILACLKSASISILVNGSPTDEFNLGRGVRQGDPLSSFLFNLVAEGLNLLTKASVSCNLYKGVEIGEDKIHISHLKYVDDMIFFGDWNTTNILNLMKLLKCFELTSGLKINIHKSHLFGVGVDNSEVESVAMDRIVWDGSRCTPQWHWTREPFGRSAGELDSLNGMLDAAILTLEKGDTWRWHLSNNGLFTTKELSILIDDKLLNAGTNCVETLRNNLVPKKVEVFVWRARRRRIPVLEELDKRGIDLHSLRCPVCDEDIETVEHSLIFSKHAYGVWAKVYDWWGLV